MKNFVFQNTTKLIFGKGMIAKLGKELPAGKKIMVTYGGGSVKKNGVWEQVTAALKGFDYVEFWGIEPNPTVETLRKAVELGKEKKVDFLLAVGGGSVLDGTKLVAQALLSDEDAWAIVKRGGMMPGVPFASVMTLPATGSEMNRNAVISSSQSKEKFPLAGAYPVFSILDPETTFSLPPFQIAVGICDTFVHVMEQYMTWPGQSPLMDRWAEGILSTLVEIAPKIKADQTNYDVMADFMLCATMALNGFIAMGVVEDWATHRIGHEITALHGTTHGATLAIVLPALLKVMRKTKGAKILQYGQRVWGITEGSEDARIDKTIDATENFFRSLGLSTRLGEENIGDDTIAEIEKRFRERETVLGENHDITSAVTRKILEAAK